MGGRGAAGGVVACCLLLSGGLPAAAADTATRPKSLEERVEELEKAQRAHQDAIREQQRLEQRVEELEGEKATEQRAAEREQQRLERRVEELEAAQVAQEDSTRAIIAGALSDLATRINQFVDFGGVIEVLPAWEEDFFGDDAQSIALNTIELQFEVQVTDWARSSLVVEYESGTDVIFTTTEDDEFSVDRFNVDTAFVTLGNPERFPPYLKIGRMVVPFGISTGDPVADVLNITDPLTVEVFETRADALLVGFDFPTPTPTPELLTAPPPPVRPQVVAPLVGRLARMLGYRPVPPAPPVPMLVPIPTPPAPFTLGAYFYNGQTFDKFSREGDWDLAHHMGAMGAYRTRGRCRPYLGEGADRQDLNLLHVFCPWKLDVGVEFNRSVFDSNFLSFDYRSFIAGDPLLGRQPIGFVPGMAASVKSNLGPVSLVAEWNGALNSASFVYDDPFIGERRVQRRPRAWQVSLGYQLDWNSGVEAIGAQGTYITIGYSASRDLGGALRFNPNDFTFSRVGFVPKRRVAVGAGEWVLPNLRIAVEYARAWDFERSHGGTGREADAVLSMVTFEW